MPIYEYQCEKCNTVTEKLQAMGDKPLRKCPSCGGRLHKNLSPGAFVFKGAGFYANDYAHKSHEGGNGRSSKKPAACPVSSGDAPPPACAGCPKAE